MKKLITIIAALMLLSCQSEIKKEQIKTIKANSASQRINSSEANSKDTLKELDE